MEQLPYPPRQTPFNEPFWTALRAGRLTTTACRDCGHKTFPPKAVCPGCWSQSLHWVNLEGKGWLRSFTEVWAAPAPFQPDIPYTLGLVDLVENVRLLTRIEARYEDLTPDQAVQLAVRQCAPVPLFYFKAAPTSA